MAEPFLCRRCGHCCHGELGIVLSDADVERLAAHLGLGRQEFLAQATVERHGKRYLGVGPDGYCRYFLADAGGAPGCGAHAARPDICRAWPFFRGNIVDPVSWTMAAEDCPGIDAAAGHTAFAAAGLDYLRHHGLADPHGAATALRLPNAAGDSQDSGKG